MRFLTGLFVLIIAAPIAAQSPDAPTDRGSKILSGTASVSHTSSGGGVTNVSLQPSLLYFMADRVALGGGIGLSYADGENASVTTWSLGPELRFYFKSSSAKTLPYVGAAVRFGASNADSDISEGADASFWALEGVAGLTFMLSRQVGVAGEAFVSRDEQTFDTQLADVTNSATRFGLRFGITAFIF